MVTSADADGRRMMICPACGYPSAGLRAACNQNFPTAPVEQIMNTIPGGPDFNPVA
jgi:hypothetical protein